MKKSSPYRIKSISEQHRLLSLPKPLHPLVTVFNFEDITYNTDELSGNFVLDFYCISIKKDFKGKMKYGQNYYDFDEGVMTFISPNQILSTVDKSEYAVKGWCLNFHIDLIRQYPLAKKMNEYGFFSYAINEALHLSEKEEAMMISIMEKIDQEYRSAIDGFSQDVIVSQIELLLTYSNRFYNRQFHTRRNGNNDLLVKLEALLTDYFNSEKIQKTGIPTVQYISDQLNVSPNYLSDMLRTLTGQSTQQHIHNKVIEKAKEILTTTNLSVGEISWQLGFEYSQSFNKLFKNKTNMSPLQFRQSFN